MTEETKTTCTKCNDTGIVLIPFFSASLEAECECVDTPTVEVEVKGVTFRVETTP